MAEIVIKKRVSLAFLGDDYQDSYITVKYVPVKEYDDLILKANQAADKKQSVQFVQDQIKERFVEGKLQQDGKLVDLTAEDLDSFPAEAFIVAYQEITGQSDPKS